MFKFLKNNKARGPVKIPEEFLKFPDLFIMVRKIKYFKNMERTEY